MSILRGGNSANIMTMVLPTAPIACIHQYEHSATVLGRLAACKSLRHLDLSDVVDPKLSLHRGTKLARRSTAIPDWLPARQRTSTSGTQHHAHFNHAQPSIVLIGPSSALYLRHLQNLEKLSVPLKALHIRLERLHERVRGTRHPTSPQTMVLCAVSRSSKHVAPFIGYYTSQSHAEALRSCVFV